MCINSKARVNALARATLISAVLCYFMQIFLPLKGAKNNMNESTLSSIITLFCFAGVILYLPLKPHWNKIFSFLDAIFFYVGIGAPILYIVLLKDYPSISGVITGIVVGGGFFLYGMYRLVLCWCRCSNIIQVIFTPICMLLMVGAFFVSLLSIMLILVGFSSNRWFDWDYWQ